MHRSYALSLLLPGLLAAVFLAAWPVCAPAADDPKEILDGLRKQGHYAEAIAFLERARSGDAALQAFAKTIDYELAVTEMDWAAKLPETDRDARLQRAQESLAKFLADQPQHALAAKARSQLASVLLDRGRTERILAGQFEGPARQQRFEAARRFLKQADEQWEGIDKAAGEELRRIGFVRENDLKQGEARDEIHRRQLQARLARAWAQYETAQTFAAGSAARMTALQEAAVRFDAIYDQQPERLAGLYARLGRGLCSKDLGENEKAFAIFEGLIILPDDSPDFHALRAKACVQALETSLRPELKKYKQGLDIARRWTGDDRPESAGQSAAMSGEADLAIRFLGGEAALAYAKTLPATPPEQGRLQAQQVAWARQQFSIVAAVAGPFQQKAKVHLLEADERKPEASPPGTFADARNRAQAALDRFLTARREQTEALQSGANNPDAQRQRQQQVAAAYNEALKYCQLAIDLHRAATGAAVMSGEDFDAVRYYLAYLHYVSDELEQAATLGEAVAHDSSDSPAAREAARIGLAAREALLRRAIATARPVARERLQALAEKITQRWRDRSEADDAREALLDLALGEGRLEVAEQFLQQISALSPRRGEGELHLGQALWQRGQRLLRSSTLEHDHVAEAEKTIAHAADLLGDGIARTRKAVEEGPGASETGLDAKRPLAAGLLALAQIHLTEGRPAEAIALLEDPSLSAEESFGLALLAYVATGRIDKAKLCLQTIQASLPTTDNGRSARQTLETCLHIQRLIRQHLAGYRDRRLDELAKQIVQGFDDFLASPAEGPTAGSFFVQAFRAEAYAGLAAGLDIGGPAVSPDANRQYRRAVAALRELLSRASTDNGFSPSPEVTVALRIELARCLRRLSDNPQALSQILFVLKDHPLMVDAQAEAAYTYQAWGEEKPEYLEMAIHGGKRYQEVWGWGELARRVQGEARFRDIFHEARYNLAFCRLRQAQVATERSERSRLAEAAEDDILATRRLIPDMGGGVWYDRYDELLKRIQRMADRPVTGLAPMKK